MQSPSCVTVVASFATSISQSKRADFESFALALDFRLRNTQVKRLRGADDGQLYRGIR